MGWFSSNTENKAENLGNENVNNVVINEPVTLDHIDLIICVYIITVILVIKFILTLYQMHKKNLKKKYNTQKKPTTI